MLVILFIALIVCSHLALHEESLWSHYFHDKSASQVSSIILSRWFVVDISVILLGWFKHQGIHAKVNHFFLLLIYLTDKVGLTICSKLAVQIMQLFLNN
jgi:hypothetical protein